MNTSIQSNLKYDHSTTIQKQCDHLNPIQLKNVITAMLSNPAKIWNKITQIQPNRKCDQFNRFQFNPIENVINSINFNPIQSNRKCDQFNQFQSNPIQSVVTSIHSILNLPSHMFSPPQKNIIWTKKIYWNQIKHLKNYT
jgi:hypothetical protein